MLYREIIVYVKQSNTISKDVNIQKATCFGQNLAILGPYKEYFRQNMDDIHARIASLLLQLCSTNWMFLCDVKYEMWNCV
jgi:hypothetical protein